MKMKDNHCLVCGKEFIRKKYAFNKKYCSSYCRWKAWKIKHLKKYQDYQKLWVSKNPKYKTDFNKKYNGSIQLKARSKANRLIKIPKGQLCQGCNRNLAIERHHEDYNKPLKVEFLCKDCHINKNNLLLVKGGVKI